MHLHVNVLICYVLLIFTTLSDEISLAQQKHKNHIEMLRGRRNVLANPTGMAYHKLQKLNAVMTITRGYILLIFYFILMFILNQFLF